MNVWAKLVKKVYNANKKTRKDYKLADAMRDAKKIYKKGGTQKLRGGKTMPLSPATIGEEISHKVMGGTGSHVVSGSAAAAANPTAHPTQKGGSRRKSRKNKH
jgi:hypothetical protein